MKKTKVSIKNIIWGLITLALATITTYKIILVYFYYVAETNNTTAPIAALLTSIPVGFYLFHFSIAVFKYIIKFTRHTLKAIA